MKKFSKLLLGAAILGVGIGGISVSITSGKTNQVNATNGTDSLTAATLNLGTSYTNFSYSSSPTGAAYVGNTMSNKAKDYIQLRTKNSTEGIVCTTSAGTISSISVTFYTSSSSTSTAVGRAVDIYASNTAYTGNNASSLYGTNSGIKVATLTYASGTTTYKYDFTTAYSYFGIKSSDSSLYLSSISVTWGAIADVPVTGLSLSKTEISGVPGGSETLTPTFTPENTSHREVTWASSNNSIATVTDGTVNFVAIGSATITATSTSKSSLSASCAVTVTAPTTYALVTSLNDIHVGAELVFVNQTNLVAMAKTTINSSYMDKTTITLSANSVAQVNGLGIFTFGIGETKDTFTFRNETDSQYLTAGSSGNALVLGTSLSVSTNWSIALGEGGIATITANGRTLFYNSTYSDFGTTTSTISSGQDIYLYQKAASTGSLTSIATTGTLTKSKYKPGDIFDSTGLTVTGTFNDSSSTQVNLSAWVVWPAEGTTLGQTSVTGTVSVLGVSKNIVESITVEEVTLSSIAITTQATKRTYCIGDSLDLAGLVVTATYGDSTTEDVTAKCSFDPANGSILSTAGTTTVNVSYGGKSTSYGVTVEAPAHSLKKVTSVDQLVLGAEIVILSDETTPIAMSKTQNTNNRGKTEANPSANALNLLSTSEAAVFTLGAGTISGTYSLKDSSGYLCAASSSNNYLRSETTLDNEGSWAITISSGTASLTAQGTNTRKVMQYNSGSSLFACYSSASQKDIVLYEQTTYFDAADWAISFNTTLNATCNNTAPTAISSTTWGNQSTSYGTLSTDEKAILKAVNVTGYNDNASIKEAVSRYDYVMNKTAYSSFADFMNRFPSRSSGAITVSRTTDGQTNIIAIVATVCTLAACSGYFFYKKKRAQ